MQAISPPPPPTPSEDGAPVNVFVFNPGSACYCDGYLMAAFQGGWFALGTIILGFIAGAVWSSSRRWAIVWAAFGLLSTITGFALEYLDRREETVLLISENRSREADYLAYLDHYLAAIPLQTLFNAVVLVLIPALIALSIAKIRAFGHRMATR